MQGEPLEQWTRRLGNALDGLPETVETAHRGLGPKLRVALAKASPRRTGDLARSWRDAYSGGSVVVASDHPAAPIVEHGGRIVGRPLLAVPIAIDARKLGGPRQDSHRLFVLRARDGRLFLATRQGGHVALRWRLMSSVTQRGRPYQRAVFEQIGRSGASDLVSAIRSEVRRG